MKLLVLVICTLWILSSALTATSRRNPRLYYPHAVINSAYNPINPDFDYPEFTVINQSVLNTSYEGESYAGYLQVNSTSKSKIFYALYPAGGSDNSSATVNNSAPLILWLQGGPGCADGIGNYGEIGPYAIANESGTPTPNLRDITWNDDYNLLFVDSPAGVGYSVNGGEIYNSGYDVAQHLETFLIRFFEVYPSLSKSDFFVFGESYGGHYVPALGTVLLLNNKDNGINLKGIGVGNGCTDIYNQAASTPDLAFSLGLLDNRNRDVIAGLEIEAQQLARAGNLTGSQLVIDQIGDLIADLDFNVNQYNFEQYEPTNPPPDAYEVWLNTKAVKKAYGVDPNVTYSDCVSVEKDFLADLVTSYAPNYTYLLTQDVVKDFKIVIYGGQNDMICDNLGVQLFLSKLDWADISNWSDSKKQILKLDDGSVIGNYKHYDRLTFAIVYGAGHMSPTDQPASVRSVLKRFMENSF